MREVVVVGSGASSIHFAQTALDRGWKVIMLDVGRVGAEPVAPDKTFLELIEGPEDTDQYFLGEAFSGVTFPGGEGEYYGFAPHRKYIFDGHPEYQLRNRGFEPLQSFARGGLAEAWTGGSFPFGEAELEDFPFGYADLEPHYSKVAERIGIMGLEDDLSPHMPVHGHLSEPVQMDAHSADLLARYQKKKDSLRRRGIHLGRSRMAVLRDDRGDRKGCTKLGRCLWGCPRKAMYTPSLGLAELQAHPHFDYRPEHFVRRFEADDSGRIQAVVADTPEGEVRIGVERLVLGAGTLASVAIFLRSVEQHRGERWILDGLMDNRQVLVPFLNLRRLGRPFDADAYQYHQLAFGVEDKVTPKRYVHGLVTTLKTALVHPVIQSVPLDVKTSMAVFRHLHGALALVNVNFWDERRPENTLRLEAQADGDRLVVDYRPPANEDERTRRGVGAIRSALWSLGCIVPPGMQHTRPMGASVHYAGALPMRSTPAPRTTDPNGKSHDFDNLWFVDGTTFPFLPAKNLTFTLMANATRIATEAF